MRTKSFLLPGIVAGLAAAACGGSTPQPDGGLSSTATGGVGGTGGSDTAWCHAYPTQGGVIDGLATDAQRNVYFVVRNADLDGGVIHGPIILKFDSSGAEVWRRILPGTVGGLAVSAGAGDRLLMASSFSGTLDVGTGLLACPGGRCPILIGLSTADGTVDFAKAIYGTNGAGTADPTALSVSPSGDIVMGGHFQGYFDCGLGQVYGGNPNQDMFLAGFTATGTCTGAASGTSTGTAYMSTVAHDASGNLVIAGYFSGTSHIGTIAITSPRAGYFVAKLVPSGTPIWVKSFPTDNATSVAAAPAPNGDVVLAAIFNGTSVDLGGGAIPLTPSGQGDLVVARFAAAGGDHLWSHGYAGGDAEGVSALATDPEGNALLSGFFQATADFGTGTLTGTGLYDGVFATYGADGKPLAAHSFGGAQDDRGSYVAMNARGTPIVTGSFQGTIDLGAGPMTSSGPASFICQLPP